MELIALVKTIAIAYKEANKNNYFCYPRSELDILSEIKSVSELKVKVKSLHPYNKGTVTRCFISILNEIINLLDAVSFDDKTVQKSKETIESCKKEIGNKFPKLFDKTFENIDAFVERVKNLNSLKLTTIPIDAKGETSKSKQLSPKSNSDNSIVNPLKTSMLKAQTHAADQKIIVANLPKQSEILRRNAPQIAKWLKDDESFEIQFQNLTQVMSKPELKTIPELNEIFIKECYIHFKDFYRKKLFIYPSLKDEKDDLVFLDNFQKKISNLTSLIKTQYNKRTGKGLDSYSGILMKSLSKQNVKPLTPTAKTVLSEQVAVDFLNSVGYRISQLSDPNSQLLPLINILGTFDPEKLILMDVIHDLKRPEPLTTLGLPIWHFWKRSVNTASEAILTLSQEPPAAANVKK